MSFLLKFLLIAIAILWLLRLVGRFLFPWAIRKAAERMMQGQQGASGYKKTHYRSPFEGRGAGARGGNRQSQQADGKIRIDYVPPRDDRQGPQKAGEFVDFEEVK